MLNNVKCSSIYYIILSFFHIIICSRAQTSLNNKNFNFLKHKNHIKFLSKKINGKVELLPYRKSQYVICIIISK
jgi:hypothetical protein